MAKFCQSCGKSLEDNAQFCAGCGATVGAAAPNPTAAPGAAAGSAQEVFDPADIEKNKAMAGLAYIIFFLPLIACPDSKFARFHANQALLVVLLIIAASIIMIIPILGWIVGFVAYIFAGVIGIMGLINGFTGKAKQLPLIGKISIIK